MELEHKETINNISTQLDSIIEILYAIQLLDLNCQEEFLSLKISDYLELPIETLAEIREKLKTL